MEAIKVTSALDEVIDFLLSSPTSAQILEFKASEAVQERIAYLLDKNRNVKMTDEENAELDELEQMDHFVTMLKARLRKKLREQAK